MSELFYMITIANRHHTRKFITLYGEQGISVNFISLGKGTAASEILDYFGLEDAEKAVIGSVVTGETWKKTKKELQKKIKIDVPGTGIAFIIPLSAVGGKKQLFFLTEGQSFVKGEETSLKDTKYELLIIIANQGYTEDIMEAARSAGATGGTVIHAKGTGMEGAEKFMGFSLASEKEMVYIVVRREIRDNIIHAVMEKAGMNSKAKAVVMSLPVSSTAGMRLMEEEPEEETL